MAFDKVVDSAALDAGMTAVADAIRAKAGTTEPLAWPDGFATAISGIETGGGDTLYMYASGTYTPATDRSFMKVTGIGFTPKIFKIFVTEDVRLDGTAKSNGTIYIEGDCVWIGSNAAGTGYAATLYLDLSTEPQSDDISSIPSSTFPHGILETGFFSFGSNREWKSGYTYEWEAWG